MSRCNKTLFAAFSSLSAVLLLLAAIAVGLLLLALFPDAPYSAQIGIAIVSAALLAAIILVAASLSTLDHPTSSTPDSRALSSIKPPAQPAVVMIRSNHVRDYDAPTIDSVLFAKSCPPSYAEREVAPPVKTYSARKYREACCSQL